MKSLISSFIGFVLSVNVSAAPFIEGQVRLDSGEPVANAQVRIFDMKDLQRGAVASATTDAAGYFALPLASLGGSALPQAWTLGQNYPNPFNPSTNHSLSCADSGSGALRGVKRVGAAGCHVS